MARVVVLDGDLRRGRLIELELARSGFSARHEEAGVAGLQAVAEALPDVVVLDLDQPDVDGLLLLRMLRAASDVPVIAMGSAPERAVRCLDLGADDHVDRRGNPGELAARIRAILRRVGAQDAQDAPVPLVVGDLQIDPAARTAALRGVALRLTRLEFDLLLTLARRAGVVVSRRELFAEVWRRTQGDDKTIDVHVSSLRAKLGERAADPVYLHTVRGIGFRLGAPADPVAGAASGEPGPSAR